MKKRIYSLLIFFTLGLGFIRAAENNADAYKTFDESLNYLEKTLRRHKPDLPVLPPALNREERIQNMIQLLVEAHKGLCFAEGHDIQARQVGFSLDLPLALKEYENKFTPAPKGPFQSAYNILFGTDWGKKGVTLAAGVGAVCINQYLSDYPFVDELITLAMIFGLEELQERKTEKMLEAKKRLESDTAFPTLEHSCNSNLFLFYYYLWGKKNPDNTFVKEQREEFEAGFSKDVAINHFDLVGTYLFLVTHKAGQDEKIQTKNGKKSQLALGWEEELSGKFSKLTEETHSIGTTTSLSELEMVIMINKLIHQAMKKMLFEGVAPIDADLSTDGRNKVQKWVKNNPYNLTSDRYSLVKRSGDAKTRIFRFKNMFVNPNSIPGDWVLLEQLQDYFDEGISKDSKSEEEVDEV